jgi:hypothetical protein
MIAPGGAAKTLPAARIDAKNPTYVARKRARQKRQT